MKKIIIFALIILSIVLAYFLSGDFTVENYQAVESNRTISPASAYPFDIPKGYSVREITDESFRTILIENAGGGGMQIVVSPYDESEESFTIDRIRMDLPDIVMNDAREIHIKDGRGVSFYSDTGYEIWFVKNGDLYQLSASVDEVSNANLIVSSFTSENE